MKHIFLTATALAVVIFLPALQAQAMPPMGPGPDVDRMIGHLEDELDLSDSQVKSVNELLESFKATATEDHARLREIRQALRDPTTAADDEQLQELTGEMGDITGRLAYNMARLHQDIQALLTPEQVGEFREMMEARSERMGERHERRMEHRERMKDRRDEGGCRESR